MSDAVSPYALLRASKPKPIPTVVTPYDLYSAAQGSAPEPPLPVSSVPAAPVSPTPRRSPLATQPGKTHYIADIKARHNQAAKDAYLRQSGSLSRHAPST